MMSIILNALGLSCTLYCLYSWLKRRNYDWFRRDLLPPGPRGLPLIGNMFDMPSSEEWTKARQWGEEFGDIVSIRILRTRYLFLNSYETAFDLLEKRSNNYSSRPMNVMLGLQGWDWLTSLIPYGPEHRMTRQFFHQFFQPAAVSKYHGLQTHCTNKMLLAILREPSNFAGHIRHHLGEMIIKIAYGYQVRERDDPYIELADKGLGSIGDALGFFFVNDFPILQYLPDWFPGAHLQFKVKRGRELSDRMLTEPFEMAKEMINTGGSTPSMTSKLLQDNTDEDGHISNETTIAKTVGSAYVGGTDTTISPFITFILTMVINPNVMRRGQEEVDKVLGKDSLPTMQDKASLPYVNAICKEILRYEPPAPFAVPHSASENDVYKGFFIPAGVTILPNVWAMTRDSVMYPEPNKFKPERWLPVDGNKEPLDSSKLVFGFGRRVCPGQYFAENSLFLGIASMLAVFDIQPALDGNNNPILPCGEYTSNLIRLPRPFKCRITPRSEKIASLVCQAVESYT